MVKNDNWIEMLEDVDRCLAEGSLVYKMYAFVRSSHKIYCVYVLHCANAAG